MHNITNVIPNENDKKGEIIYSSLAKDLMNGNLLPNERLKIRELAYAMGTSVTPVRDALLRLVHDGALSMSSPRDIRVRNVSLEEYLEIRSIRLELEGLAAANAALKITDVELKKLQDLTQENEEAIRKQEYRYAIALNQTFHFEVCRIAQMPTLMTVLNQLWMRIGPLIAQSYHQGGRSVIDHRYPVLKALINRDPQAARIAMQADIISGGNILLQFKEQEANEIKQTAT